MPPEIPPSEMPFVCSVRLQSVHRCCASILNPNWLLTSGQCTADLAPDAISIVCGIRMYRTVVEIALLPYYQPAASKPTANDLALVRKSCSKGNGLHLTRELLSFCPHLAPSGKSTQLYEQRAAHSIIRRGGSFHRDRNPRPLRTNGRTVELVEFKASGMDIDLDWSAAHLKWNVFTL